MRSALLLALGLGLAAAPAMAGQTLQAETRAWPVTPAHRVAFTFPVGDLEVEGTDGDRVRLELIVKCDHGDAAECAERAGKLELDARDEGGKLAIEVSGYPKFGKKFHLEGRLLVPRALATHIEMGVGELRVDGMAGDLDVELGVGDADVRMARAAVASVRAETGVGDAHVRVDGRRIGGSGFIAHELYWSDGPGAAKVRLKVGVGDSAVMLD